MRLKIFSVRRISLICAYLIPHQINSIFFTITETCFIQAIFLTSSPTIRSLPAIHHGEVCKVSSSVGSYRSQYITISTIFTDVFLPSPPHNTSIHLALRRLCYRRCRIAGIFPSETKAPHPTSTISPIVLGNSSSMSPRTHIDITAVLKIPVMSDFQLTLNFTFFFMYL